MKRMTGIIVAAVMGLSAPFVLSASDHKGGHETTMAAKTIVDIAVADPNFSTLVAALKAADLVETLQSAGPFTVFAPTNDAFAKLPAGTLDSLLKPENKEQLKGILLYHVVAGRVAAADVVKITEAKTVNGKSAKIDTTNGVKIDAANVVKTDIMAGNGIIHVIDAVILP